MPATRRSLTRKLALGKLRLAIHPTVFGCSVLVIGLFVAVTLLNLDSAERFFEGLKIAMTRQFGWMLVLLVQLFLLFVVFLAFSRFGHIRIGGPGARPSFSRASWFAMLFSAGMGIGLLFYGVAEPILHFQNPPLLEGGTPAAAIRAMDVTFLHWGFHAWAIYAVVALALAYFSFNKGLPLSLRSAFYPILGHRIYGPLGTVIDVAAVVATLFGVATSLGLGAAQINAGLHFLFGVPEALALQIGLIAAITLLATLSVVSGLDRGIRRLSEINLLGALLLLAFLLLGGPTLFLLKSFVQNVGHYLQNLLILASWTDTYQRDPGWQANWTLFYWTCWIAWSPFVGMFIARISRGRTVREFVGGVLLVPVVLTFLWFSVLGGSAIYAEMFNGADLATAVNQNMPVALFELLHLYPLAGLTTALAVMLVFVFFITSSDSGSLVIDIITAGGHLDPPVPQRVFWAVTEGVVAAILLAGGGVLALQTATIAAGLPMALILAVICYCLFKAFNADMPRISHYHGHEMDMAKSKPRP
jgi:choline/glycine/proline betaine transport protein